MRHPDLEQFDRPHSRQSTAFGGRAISTLLLIMLCPGPASAAWPGDPLANVPVCTASDNQMGVRVVSDGARGALLVWADYRNVTESDVYAQRIRAGGNVDANWPVNGRAICTAAGDQSSAVIVGDGSGGAIVCWEDLRNDDGSATNVDIYAQHVRGDGTVDPAWPVNGLPVCTATDRQDGLAIVSDGAGGAVATWQDRRNGLDLDIFAQRVLAGGSAAWPAGGVAVCAIAAYQYGPQIVPGAAGSALVTWYDNRNGVAPVLYTQRVRLDGTVDPGWPASGRALCSAVSRAWGNDAVVPDGAGGAIAVWGDERTVAFPYQDIYAAHVLAGGTLDSGWPAAGLAAYTGGLSQAGLRLTAVSDGAGGAIAGWGDNRGGGGYSDIYAQRVLVGGTVDPAWPVNGRAVCSFADDQSAPAMVADGTGGAIAAWEDFRSGNAGGGAFDIYAQRVRGNGTVDPAWPANGRAVSTVSHDQRECAIASDGAGGAIIAWVDRRNADYDIYAQRVQADGQLGGTVLAVNDAPPVSGFDRVWPNPGRNGICVEFGVEKLGRVALDVVDVAGRIVDVRDLGSLQPGMHRVTLRPDIRVGVYMVRVTQAGHAHVLRMVVLE